MNARRESVLREMGLAPVWRLRSAAVETPGTSALGQTPAAPGVPIRETEPRAMPAREPLDDLRPSAEVAKPVRTLSPESGADRAVDARSARIAGLTWDALEADIRACTACRLCEARKKAVPGVGDRQADWMLVGEGPGAEEDQRGEPFVGAAGKLLDSMLASIGLKRAEGVYITNAVKCRPPHNRTPENDEILACFPYLERQIELIQPRILIALGRPAAQSLLKTEVRIGAARGQVFRYREIPVIVTYHPAYLLRNQADKAKAWEDLCLARRLMREGIEG